MMKATRSPPVSRPAIMSCRPIRPTVARLAKAVKIATAVRMARARVRRRAMVKERSTEVANSARSCASSVKAWTVETAFSTSVPRAAVSAMESWLTRESLRTQRPKISIGTITASTAATTRSASLKLVTNIRASPPVSVTRLRIAIEAEDPTTVWIRVVSAVRRDSTSPVRVTSKNSGDRPSTLSNTALRMSATTRSPSHVTE